MMTGSYLEKKEGERSDKVTGTVEDYSEGFQCNKMPH